MPLHTVFAIYPWFPFYSICFSILRATNSDGRVPNLLTQEMFKPGRYKIMFDTETYFKSLEIREYFYPYVEVI